MFCQIFSLHLYRPGERLPEGEQNATRKSLTNPVTRNIDCYQDTNDQILTGLKWPHLVFIKHKSQLSDVGLW